jgi:hypothetical protein
LILCAYAGLDPDMLELLIVVLENLRRCDSS